MKTKLEQKMNSIFFGFLAIRKHKVDYNSKRWVKISLFSKQAKHLKAERNNESETEAERGV